MPRRVCLGVARSAGGKDMSGRHLKGRVPARTQDYSTVGDAGQTPGLPWFKGEIAAKWGQIRGFQYPARNIPTYVLVRMGGSVAAMARGRARSRTFLLAGRTQRADFRFVGVQGEARARDAFFQLAAHRRIADLRHGPAAGADHEQVVMRATGVVACDPGIDRVQAMDQPFIHQEVQCPVHRRRRRAGVDGPHGFEQVIGLQAAAMPQQQFQDLAAYRRQPATALRAQRFGDVQLGADAIGSGGSGGGGHNASGAGRLADVGWGRGYPTGPARGGRQVSLSLL